MKVLNLPIPFFVPISLSTHFLSYISYNEPNIPNMHSHTHYLTQESNKDPLMVGSTLLRKLWGITSVFLWYVAYKTSVAESFLLSEKAMATHSSTLAWQIPWAEDPGGLQSMESLRVGHDWVTSLSLFTFMHWRRKWKPTPVFLPGKSQGWGSLVGCHLWSRTGSDTTKWLSSSSISTFKNFISNFPLHSSCYIPVVLNSSPWLEYVLFFLVSGAIAVTIPYGHNSSPASACQEDPINPLRAGTKISFTVDSYLPLVLSPIFPDFIVVLVEFCTVHITSIVLITLFNMVFRSLVPQNRDAVNFQFLV